MTIKEKFRNTLNVRELRLLRRNENLDGELELLLKLRV